MKYLMPLIIAITSQIAIAEDLGEKDLTNIAYISIAAKHHNISKRVLIAICYVESHFNPKAIHRDDGNGDSVGMCQVKPSTAKWLGYRVKSKDLYEPYLNALVAGAYVKYLLNRYGNVDKAIVAYNLGHYSKNYKAYLKKVKKAMKLFERALPNVL